MKSLHYFWGIIYLLQHFYWGIFYILQHFYWGMYGLGQKTSSAKPQAAWPLYHSRMANAHIHAFRIANSEERIKKDDPAATAGPSLTNQMNYYGFWVL